MPSKEIKELRQSGRLEEALTMAKAELEAQPDNIWGKRNISWVYYEYLKRYAHDFNYQGFIDNLKNLETLNLPKSDVMVFDMAAWQIGSLIFKIQRIEPVDYVKINQVFDIIKEFHFTKPSEGYSLLYKSFHKGYQNWSRYIEFADWWDFANFLPEDYQKEEFNGKKIMAIAEQAYIAYSKKLLKGEQVSNMAIIDSIELPDGTVVDASSLINDLEEGRLTLPGGFTVRFDKEKINDFLVRLDKLIDAHPEYRYLSYYKTKLMLIIGGEDNVLSVILPFARQHRNDFWVWNLMVEIFESDEELQFACLCKALSLNTEEAFLIKTRHKFAEFLLKRKLYKEAKAEIEKILKVRKENGWKIPNQLSQWVQQDWYLSADTDSNNNPLYSKYLKKAEEILLQDIPEHKVVVEFVNRDKKILNFIKSKTLHGFFSYKHLPLNPAIGDILIVKLQPVGKEGFHRALSIKKSSEKEIKDLDIIKKADGNLRQNTDQNFGFLEDVFVPPEMIAENGLKNADIIEGIALLSFNKKKDQWGWRLIKIIKQS